MAYRDNGLQQLRNERRRVHSQVEKLDSVISVLEELIGRNRTAPVRPAADVVAWFLQLHGGAWAWRNEHDGPGNEHRRNKRWERR